MATRRARTAPTRKFKETVGRLRLKEWLDALDERTQEALAKLLGVSQAAVAAWVSGRSRPEPHFRESLERATGIEAGEWQTAEERRCAARGGLQHSA